MSFRLFIYCSAICGGWAALIGWAAGRLLAIPFQAGLLRTLIIGPALGACVALGLGMVDALWNSGGRQYSAAFAKGLAAALIGAIAGLIGAVTGQMLVNLTEVRLLQFVGWVLTGVLVGAAVGLYDLMMLVSKHQATDGARRKIVNGVLGGLIGGILGSLCYALIDTGLGSVFAGRGENMLSRSAWGFVALGLCVGLFIGLAQVILMEAWLKVESGFRPGRELILAKPEVTVGRAESCDLGLFGDMAIEKLHATIQQKGGRYVVVDAGTPSGTFVNDQKITQPTPLRTGDAIRVGNSVLRFSEKQKKK